MNKTMAFGVLLFSLWAIASDTTAQAPSSSQSQSRKEQDARSPAPAPAAKDPGSGAQIIDLKRGDAKGAAPQTVEHGGLFVSVRDYGARGDGRSDDRSAVQSAIDAVSASGGTVFFPPGNYLITGTLDVQANGIVIQGTSTTGARLQFNNGSADSIYVRGTPSKGIYNCQIRDLTLEHGGKKGGAAIRMYRANQCQISRVNINNPWNGLDLKAINNVIVSESVVAQIKGSFGVKFHAPADGSERSDVLTIRDTAFNLNNNGGDGIVWDGFAHTLRLFGVGILNANRGILIQNTAASRKHFPAFGEFFDLEIDGTTGTAVRMEAGSVMAFNGSELFNLANASGPVLEILADAEGSYTNAVRISNSRIFGGGKEAMTIGGRNVLLTGSQVGGGANNGYAAIRIDDGAQDFQIVANEICTSWGSPTGKYDHGVSISEKTYRGVVAWNSFYGCNGEVNNKSATATVVVGTYLNRKGIPNEPSHILRRSDGNAGTFEDKLYNAATGKDVTAQRSLATGTASAYVIDALKDNGGSPYVQRSGGTAVQAQFQDFPKHYFRTQDGSNLLSIGDALPAHPNDGAAARSGVPLYGYYWNTSTNAVAQRRM